MRHHKTSMRRAVKSMGLVLVMITALSLVGITLAASGNSEFAQKLDTMLGRGEEPEKTDAPIKSVGYDFYDSGVAPETTTRRLDGSIAIEGSTLPAGTQPNPGELHGKFDIDPNGATLSEIEKARSFETKITREDGSEFTIKGQRR